MLQVYPYKSRRRFITDGRAGGINVDKTWTVKTEAVGKSQWTESPYLMANEWIAANIAQFLRLPVPPFAIVSKKSRSTAMFISYSYEGDSTPDDVDPDALYNTFPKECTGIVVFDIFLVNCDRNGGNLKVDKPAFPKAFYLIDHERSLFYISKSEGIRRLRSRQDRLGVTDGADSANEWHCLIELLDDVSHLEHWVQKVKTIPDEFINDICEEMWKMSITRPECDEVKKFLKTRRDKIGQLIIDHKDRFPRVTNWPLFL